jgi:HK97 family phage prohead protease
MVSCWQGWRGSGERLVSGCSPLLRDHRSRAGGQANRLALASRFFERVTMRRDFQLELKSLTGQGVFEGLAAVYSNVDFQGDVIEPGAFAKTLREKGEVPILWQHDSAEPIGLGKLSDSAAGLQIKGELALESPVAHKAYGLLKRRIVTGLSIGFDGVKSRVVDGIRRLSEVRLWEVSLVTFGANPLAQVSSVKGVESIAQFRALLAQCRRSFQ